jgi:hypothetical protein
VALLLDEGAMTEKTDFKGRSAVYVAAAHGGAVQAESS